MKSARAKVCSTELSGNPFVKLRLTVRVRKGNDRGEGERRRTIGKGETASLVD
jgi:hypothetical protein